MSNIALPGGWKLEGAITQSYGQWISIALSSSAEHMTVFLGEGNPLGAQTFVVHAPPSIERADKLGSLLNHMLDRIANDVLRPADTSIPTVRERTPPPTLATIREMVPMPDYDRPA